MKTVLAICAPDAKLPARLPNSQEMQKYLESLGVNNYREAAPPPIAIKQDQD